MYETKIGQVKDPVRRFFAYCREREAIRVRREVLGQPRERWTKDPILQQFRFCNVYREDDRVTRWFRANARNAYTDRRATLMAAVIFRWFNRISTGEAVFVQRDLLTKSTAFDQFVWDGNTYSLKSAIKSYCGAGPYVTGSYMVYSPSGMSKLDGLLRYIGNFYQSVSAVPYMYAFDTETTLEGVWRYLRSHDGIGDFGAYEIVTDLRWTKLLDTAPDILTWANAGPGAIRGLNRIHGRELKKGLPKAQSLEEMVALLGRARGGMWPAEILGTPTRPWEMREVEHQLCEFDKYERVRLGQGKTKGVFR